MGQNMEKSIIEFIRKKDFNFAKEMEMRRP